MLTLELQQWLVTGAVALTQRTQRQRCVHNTDVVNPTPRPLLPRPTDVRTVVDPNHEDAHLLVVDPVDDAVCASPRAVVAVKLERERRAHSTGVLCKRPRDELGGGGRCKLGQSRKDSRR